MSRRSPDLVILYIIDLFDDVNFGQKEIIKKGKQIVSIRYADHFELARIGIYYDLWYWHIEEEEKAQKRIRESSICTA